MVLAAVEWVNPGWAWALAAAAGLPLVAHLLSRRGGTLAGFPAVRFVEAAAAQCRRLHRPRHVQLWLIRTLALACMVMALAQPVWFTAAAASPGRAGWRVVIVLDRTASMTRSHRGSTLFADAQRRALALLNELDPARDRAAVVVVDDAPRASAGGLAANFAALGEEIRSLSPVLTHGDAAGAMALAAALLRGGGDGPQGEARVHVITDGQASQWRDLRPPEQARLTWHLVGTPQGNCSVFSPQVQPARVVAGQPARASVQVANHSAQPRDVNVRMRAEAATLTRTIRLDPWATGTLAFDWTPDRAGEVPLQWALAEDDDALAFDDEVGLAVPVAARRPVAVLTRSATDDAGTAAHAVQQALVADGAGLAVTVQSPDAAVARGVDAAVLVEAGGMRAEDVAWFAGRRGTVIHVVDSRAAAAALEAAWVEEDSAAVGEVDLGSPVLSAFEGAAVTPLMQARFARRAVGDDGAGAVLIRMADGSPLLTVRSQPHGWEARLWADLAPGSSTFTRGPAFAPLLHQLVRELAPPSPPRAVLQWTTVVGEPGRAVPGWDGGVWRAVRPEESDLGQLQHERGGDGDAAVAGADTGAGDSRRIDLWPWLLAAGLIVLAGEAWLAGREGASP